MSHPHDLHPLTELEAEVLNWLLAGEDPVLLGLRNQLAIASVISREMTGHGFYLHFSIPPSTSKLHEKLPCKPSFCFGDVNASVEGLNHGAGFLLWVTNGVLDFLEGYTYDGDWPLEIQQFWLDYIGGKRNEAVLRRQWETGLGA
jgi:hypothetical protein